MVKQSLFLVGPMGAGKTTIGKLLAQELKLKFKDTDKEIEERTGADIAWIFDVEGEQGFRQRETQILDELTQELPPLVLATGGGVVIKPENRGFLCARGVVVYLQASIASQVERTSKDKKRPLLQNENPQKVLEDLMQQRQPLYHEVADLVMDTDVDSPKMIVKKVMAHLNA